ncbi:MAG: hypothetical protein C0507_01975 [Cyanobacteria bacterium PR.3.49]|nr:hypothetical protein [Cyanobacteria bacterium PR.3.49]
MPVGIPLRTRDQAAKRLNSEYKSKFTSIDKVIAIYTWQIRIWVAITRAAGDSLRAKQLLPPGAHI